MIPKRLFGRTGHQSSIALFGAAALKRSTQAEADRVLDLLLEHGVNHIDTAPRYGDSELRVGPWMAAHRKDFFLATKTGERTYAGAWDQLRRSLDRLRVDHVDLIQIHALAHPGEWAQAFGAGGVVEALIEAREQGLARFIGVTGHGWTIAAMHKRSLQRFDFDAVLMPYNHVMHENARYRADFEEVVRICGERKAAVQVIKSIARGPWATTPPTHDTWYQPLEAQADIDLAVRWLLARGEFFLNTAGDVQLLPKVLAAVARAADGGDVEDARMQELTQERRLTSLFGIG